VVWQSWKLHNPGNNLRIRSPLFKAAEEQVIRPHSSIDWPTINTPRILRRQASMQEHLRGVEDVGTESYRFLVRHGHDCGSDQSGHLLLRAPWELAKSI